MTVSGFAPSHHIAQKLYEERVTVRQIADRQISVVGNYIIVACCILLRSEGCTMEPQHEAHGTPAGNCDGVM